MADSFSVKNGSMMTFSSSGRESPLSLELLLSICDILLEAGSNWTRTGC